MIKINHVSKNRRNTVPLHLYEWNISQTCLNESSQTNIHMVSLQGKHYHHNSSVSRAKTFRWSTSSQSEMLSPIGAHMTRVAKKICFITWAACESSDKPDQPHSVVRAFAIHIRLVCALSCPPSKHYSPSKQYRYTGWSIYIYWSKYLKDRFS